MFMPRSIVYKTSYIVIFARSLVIRSVCDDSDYNHNKTVFHQTVVLIVANYIMHIYD